MAWAITIATFLGTVLTVLLIFWISFERNQIRAAPGERRIEGRILVQGELMLSSLDEPLIYERALGENASRHGVRVVVKKPRRPDDYLLVRSPRWDGPSRARVVYCNALPGDVCAIGLQFTSVVDDSLTSKSDMSNDEP